MARSLDAADVADVPALLEAMVGWLEPPDHVRPGPLLRRWSQDFGRFLMLRAKHYNPLRVELRHPVISGLDRSPGRPRPSRRLDARGEPAPDRFRSSLTSLRHPDEGPCDPGNPRAAAAAAPSRDSERSLGHGRSLHAEVKGRLTAPCLDASKEAGDGGRSRHAIAGHGAQTDRPGSGPASADQGEHDGASRVSASQQVQVWMPGSGLGKTDDDGPARGRAPDTADPGPAIAPLDGLRRHWPEYLMEAAGLGLFMISAGLFGTLLFHPASPVATALPEPLLRRALMGLIMGLTAVSIIYSPWGQQSGAHLNPAVTLTFWRLGKVATWDAVFYVLAQFVGGALGVALVARLLGALFTDPPVSALATLPGPAGEQVALIAEAAIAFGLMITVLFATNSARLMRFTGIFAGVLVALYITFEAPLSGMSLNPARSLASALPSSLWQGLWIYFIAPPLGMLLAAEAYRLMRRPPAAGSSSARRDSHPGTRILCAKLNHHTHRRCIFHCGYAAREQQRR